MKIIKVKTKNRRGSSITTPHRPRPYLITVAGSGLAAGLISSLAISALILLVEKLAALPVGTFYLVLVSALLQLQEQTVYAIAIGLLMHLAAGSIIGLIISTPFAVSKRAMAAMNKYAPVYGLAAGFALWLALFLPITFGIVLPLINALSDGGAGGGSSSGNDNQAIVIRQQMPTGEVSSIATDELLAIMDKVIVGSLAFNVFYGLLTVMLTKSFSEALFQRRAAKAAGKFY